MIEKPDNVGDKPPKPPTTPNPPDSGKFKEAMGSDGKNKDDDKENVKIDPRLHPFAQYFIKNWGWTPKQALKADEQFFNNYMHQCQEILNKNAQIFKALDPKNPENQDQ